MDEDTRAEIKSILYDELDHFLTDIERRLGQTYELARENGRGYVYAEDIHDNIHRVTGYTVTANTPPGGITWANLHIVYNGTDYTITGANTLLKYIWFDAAVSTTLLQFNNTKPTLAGNACLVFINNAGVPVSVLESNTIPQVVANNSIDTLALQDSAVTGLKILDGTIMGTEINNAANIAGSQLAANAGLVGAQLAAGANIAGTQIAANAGLVGTQLANNTLTTTQISNTANITGSQLSASANIAGGQISSTANIVGTQLANNTLTTTQISPTANITGTQLANLTITGAQLNGGAVSAPKLSVLSHVIY